MRASTVSADREGTGVTSEEKDELHQEIPQRLIMAKVQNVSCGSGEVCCVIGRANMLNLEW